MKSLHQHHRALTPRAIATGIALCLGFFAALASAQTAQPARVWPHLLNPREYPDDPRRAVQPPSWETFQGLPQFTCLRGFEVNDQGIITNFQAELDKFAKHDLGTVIWPSYPILFAKNLGELAEEIQRRNLFLFDIWGYVPGSGPGGYWQQFQPKPEAFALLEQKLGNRWLGTDIGEQDGRYIGGYAEQMTPAAASRLEQYFNFQRHFEKMSSDLGYKHATLVSLNYGHYLLKEGTFTMIGAETAQALPNNQVYYAFIRGAGKQYGVPWFGNASIYNRWGFKNYAASGHSDGTDYGPSKGSSLSLLKRLLYSHLLYNCVAAGFENGWFVGDQLSPIGVVQQSAQKWIRQQGQPGIMHTPVGLLFDFYSGWTFPRHLYSGRVYRVWGNLPYNEGDYFADAVLNLLYPGYQNSSYFHDESGFITSTPYGDIADCLLSDAPAWVLSRYPVLVVVSDFAGGRELRDKLQAYLDAGGHLLITSNNLARLPQGLAANPTGKGKLTVLASPLLPNTDAGTIRSENDKPLPKPFQLTSAAREALDSAFRSEILFDAGNPELALITCRKSAGEYTLGVLNNTWRPLPLKISSLHGDIDSLEEILPPGQDHTQPGYTPEGTDASALGTPDTSVIAGGSVRIFSVKIREQNVQEIARATPPPRPQGRWLPLPQAATLKREILSRPTFFEHYDGVMIGSRYVRERTAEALRSEAGWLRRQKVRIGVDLSSEIDLYPQFRLLENDPAPYRESLEAIESLLAKMPMLGSRDLLLTLHRHPENNFSDTQARDSFTHTLQRLAKKAAENQITLHLRMAFGKPPWNIGEAVAFIRKVGAPNLKLAPALALMTKEDFDRVPPEMLGLWLAAGRQKDVAGELWNAHAPLAGTAPPSEWLTQLNAHPEIPVVFDAVYAGPDEEYLDAAWLEQTAAASTAVK